MKAKHRKKRRAVRILAGLCLGGVFVLLFLPMWFPWLAVPALRHFGLRFEGYVRIGWTRFALNGVHGSWGGTQLEFKRVECVLPTTWLWQRFKDDTNNPPLLSLIDGRLISLGAATNVVTVGQAAPEGTADETLNEISQIGSALQQWLPVANLTNCTVQVASMRITIPHAEWRTGRLQAAVRLPSGRGEIEMAGGMGGESVLDLSANWPAYAASLRGKFSRTDAGWHWRGGFGWLTNRAEFAAHFATNGWWPAQAQAECLNWRIPADFFQLQGRESLVASLTANLASNCFGLQATGLAQPTGAAARSGWPTVKLSLSADGDPARVNLRSLNISTPWLNADLTNPIGVTWTGKLRAEPAQLRVSLDLDQLPGATLRGKAEGWVRIMPQGTGPPAAQFRLAATPLRAGPLDTKTVLVRGELNAPILKLDEIRADFTDGSVLAANGSFDMEAGRIADGHWKLSGDLLSELVKGLNYADWTASGEVDGPLTNLTHHGETTFTHVQAIGLKPLDLHAKWSGQNQQLTAAEIQLTSGDSVLSLGASVDFKLPEHEVSATLNRLSLSRAGEELYALQRPCAVTFGAGKSKVAGSLWTLALDGFDWLGARQNISGSANVVWPSIGAATLALTNVAIADFSDFLEGESTNLAIAELAATAHWSNGPVQAEISGTGSMTSRSGQLFGLCGTVKADEQVIVKVSALAEGYTPALEVIGAVPVKIVPERGDEMMVWDKSQGIALTGNWKDDKAKTFSLPLGAFGQLEIAHPELHFRISGTPDAPTADLTLAAARLAWKSKTNHSTLPRLDDLQSAIRMQPDAIQLKSFGAKLDGQPITASGAWPLSADDWREWWSNGKLPDWKQARGQLKLQGAQVAAFAAYLPAMLSPEGQLNAILELKPGKQWEGVLSLTNAATRPLGPIPPLRDIATVVRLGGGRATLNEFRARIGGQPIRADGFVTLPERNGSKPDYFLKLTGTNVPLARSPEFLLRGDFVLSLRGGSNLPPLLSGAVTLRDGLYVQYASDLVWSSPARPGWRPPYFSVTNEPFANWKLDLAIHGDRFLRARTPVFSSVVSTDLRLQGSLRAPVLTGDARVNSGRVIFPFGTLTVDQGLASFSRHDLNGPDLEITASGRNYGYDVRLEVKGPADGANVIFSSTPPLTSEQILLMLTAGVLPESAYSFTSSARAGQLASFLGKDLLSRYLGSDPSQERLIIRTGENISDNGRLTYSVEYRLTNRWSIRGEYDEFGDYNVDLIWKIFAR